MDKGALCEETASPEIFATDRSLAVPGFLLNSAASTISTWVGLSLRILLVKFSGTVSHSKSFTRLDVLPLNCLTISTPTASSPRRGLPTPRTTIFRLFLSHFFSWSDNANFVILLAFFTIFVWVAFSRKAYLGFSTSYSTSHPSNLN